MDFILRPPGWDVLLETPNIRICKFMGFFFPLVIYQISQSILSSLLPVGCKSGSPNISYINSHLLCNRFVVLYLYSQLCMGVPESQDTPCYPSWMINP